MLFACIWQCLALPLDENAEDFKKGEAVDYFFLSCKLSAKHICLLRDATTGFVSIQTVFFEL